MNYQSITNLVEMYFDRVETYGNAPFLWAKTNGEWHTTSWHESADIVGSLSRALVNLGIEAGDRVAYYIAFGAFFPSVSKEAKHHATPEILEFWSQMTVVPCVAIGGITSENCGQLIDAGANYLAVIGSIWNHPDGPEAGVRAFANVLPPS